MHRAQPVRCTHHPLGMALSCLLVLSCLLTLGCTSHPRKQIPQGWDIATPVNHEPSAADMPQASMQVFICYGWMTSNHACLRITGPEQHTLFWDPGGGYGQHDQEIPTKNDMLLDHHALSIDQVWRYRNVGCNEPAMLMFEWPLTQKEALDLRDVLVEGRRKDGQGGSFNSDVPGGFCSMALSGFLRTFASQTPLPRRWFWPHNLAKRLWTYDPARVVLYEHDKQPVVYMASQSRGWRDALQTAKMNAE